MVTCTPKLTLVAVGDLQLGDSPTTVGYGFYSRYRGRPLDVLFDEVRPLMDGADILFGNLETTLVPADPGEPSRASLQLRGEPEFAKALRRTGFTVLNVANNHAVQHGSQTFHSTIATLRDAGIACCGIRGTDGWTTEPVMLQQGAVGILGYCLRPRQYGPEVPPYAEGSRDEICRDVRRLRESSVTVVVSLHWGEEFVTMPSKDEISLAHAIIDAGAVLLLGHHPHVIRPVERYGHGTIVYSLGNFLGDMVWYAPFRRGAVFRCILTDSGIADATMAPTRLGSDYQPRPTGEPATSSMSSEQIRGLDAEQYARAIATSWRKQRAAGYFAAIVNLPRTPLRILVQLAHQTVRNKFAALMARVRSSG